MLWTLGATDEVFLAKGRHDSVTLPQNVLGEGRACAPLNRVVVVCRGTITAGDNAQRGRLPHSRANLIRHTSYTPLVEFRAGTIPGVLSRLEMLRVLDLSANRLEGECQWMGLVVRVAMRPLDPCRVSSPGLQAVLGANARGSTNNRVVSSTNVSNPRSRASVTVKSMPC